MNKYLLLRDNKQTGPHSLDEIKEMGLKKYDLIWVEGKSAAWRYPGELDEMRSFAPPVEEQPFDRFFKKPVKEEHYQLLQQKKQDSIESPTEEKKQVKKEEKKIPPRKYVSISLPRSSNIKIDPVKTVSPQKEQPAKPVEVKTESQPKLEPIFPPRQDLEAKTPPPAHTIDPKIDDMPRQHPVSRESGFSVPDLLQYTALGLGVFSILLIIYLVTSGQDEHYSTLPVQKTVTKIKEPVPEPVVQEMTPMPAVNSFAAEQKETAEPTTASFKKASTPVAPDPLREEKTVSGSFDNPAEKQVVSTPVSLSSKVSAELSDYRVNVLGGIDDISVKLTNHSAYKLDLVVVELQYLLTNRKIFKTETLRFRDIEPGEVSALYAPKTNRGVKVNSKITYITSSQAGVSENL